MRGIKQDDGIVAVLVALLAVALFGFAAVVVDVGILFQERRQLQNGADATALAVAQGCAGGTCAQAVAAAPDFVEGNHSVAPAPGVPGRGRLVQLCGHAGSPSLPTCTRIEDSRYAGNYVVARVASGTRNASLGVTPFLTSVLPGERSSADVRGRAVVRWGRPGSVLTQLPVTMSRCRWNILTDSGRQLLPPPPPRSSWTNNTYPKNSATRATERAQSLITQTAAVPGVTDSCASVTRLAPGNFNWLATDPTNDNCEARAFDRTNTKFDNTPGADVPQDCRDELAALVGQIVAIPIYTFGPENGSVGDYRVDGFAAFFVTGLYLNGNSSLNINSIIKAVSTSNQDPCKKPTFCISGFFVRAPLDGEISDGGGTDRGLTAIQMAY